MILILVLLIFSGVAFGDEDEKVPVQSQLGDPIDANTLSGFGKQSVQTMIVEQTPENLAKILKSCRENDKFLLGNKEACQSALGVEFPARWASVSKKSPQKVPPKVKPKSQAKSSPPIPQIPMPSQVVTPSPVQPKRFITEDPPEGSTAQVLFFGGKKPYGDDEKIDRSYEVNYDKQGIKKTTASYPVDLTRVITAKKFINAVLITEINSQLDGIVKANVQNNVYGDHGMKILIPAGSQMIGTYKNSVANGQSRLGVIWERIITPRGINIVFNGYAGDIQGRVGLTGEVDNRLLERYGYAMFSSIAELTIALAAYKGAEALTKNKDGSSTVIINESTKNTADSLSVITKQILADNMNLRPIIKIPYGSQLTVNFNMDIYFKEPIYDITEAIPLAELKPRNDAETNKDLEFSKTTRYQGGAYEQ